MVLIFNLKSDDQFIEELGLRQLPVYDEAGRSSLFASLYYELSDENQDIFFI